MPPQTTSSYAMRTATANKAGKLDDQKYKEGDVILNKQGLPAKEPDPKSFKMVNKGASDRINSLTGGQKEKHIYYVELPIPQDVNDNNSVTWGDDSMNILQLAGLAVAQKAFTQDIGKTFDEAKNLLTEGIFEGATMLKLSLIHI